MTSESNRKHKGAPDRRQVLAGASATAGLTLAANALPRRGSAQEGPEPNRTLIVLFMRGGAEQLTWNAPVQDPYYFQTQRPNISVPTPTNADLRRWLDDANGQHDGFALPLSATAGLNTLDIKRPFENGDLTFVLGTGLSCAVGTCGNNRSHFEAMNYMENGATPGTSLFSNGWFARYLAVAGPQQLLRGVSHSAILPRSFAGSSGVVAKKDVANFPFPGRAVTKAKRKSTLETLYVTSSEPSALMASAASTSFTAQETLENVNHTQPDPGFPQTPFGQAMYKTANILRAGIPLEAVHFDYGGWDHHNDLDPNVPTLDAGKFYPMSNDVSQSVGAFWQAMKDAEMEDRYIFIGVSEFGRRVFENISAGTDHGTGGLAFVMGSGVRSGLFSRKVFCKNWIKPSSANPTTTGLRSPGVLVGQGGPDEDLAIGVDIREVLGEIMVRRLGLTTNQVFGTASQTSRVFPGVATPNPWPGIVG